MVEKKEGAERKEAKKKAHPEHGKESKEAVRKLIEEKMKKIRKHDIADEKPAEKEHKAKEKKDEEKEGGKAPRPKQLPQSAFVTGKRKRAIARGFFCQGKGTIKVNSVPLELAQPEVLRLRMMEPLLILGDGWRKIDGKITVRGGGPQGQADAVRQVIARGLSELLGPEARKAFLSYDRNLIVYDPRRTEPHKPPRSSQGPRRYKQRSKR
jgi:small subunit ribosomal protein S9